MPFALHDKLVIAVASSALFDLSQSDAVYRAQGVEAYPAFQRQHEKELLLPGVALPLTCATK